MRIFPAFALLVVAVVAAAAEAPPAAAPFLWEVQGPHARHWLLGSVHLLPEEANPLPPALEQAYAASDMLIVETDLEALAAPEVQNRMLGAARETRSGGLKARIGKSLYGKLQKRAQALGMPTPVCDEFRAWFCALALELFPLQQANFRMEFGIDRQYYARAREDGHPILGLETADTQIDLFASMPEGLSRQMLAATLDEATYDSQTPEELYRIWRRSDVAALEKVVKEMRVKYPALYGRLIADRNRAWLPPLAERLRGDTPVLLIVGAAHLVGPEGLVQLLKAQGLDARPAGTPAPAAAPQELI